MTDFKRYGFDFTLNQPEIEQISMVSMESEGTSGMFDTGVVRGTEFFMRGMTADMVKKLKEGTAYLKFWIVAIDHTKPTANNKLYPMGPFEEGLQCPFFQQQLHNGGVPGKLPYHI